MALKSTLQTTICLLLLATGLSSCEEENPLQVPVPDNGVEISIERLDRAWFEMTPVSFRENHPRWIEEYGELYVRYIEDVLELGSANDSGLYMEIRRFTTDESISEVQGEVQKTFADISTLEEELSHAWSYYHYYFPSRIVPKHLTMIGGFNTPAALTENGVGIALEMFLGSDCRFYDYLQLPVYMRTRMTPDQVAPTVLKGWLETEFPMENPTPNLLEVMILRGKVLYCLDAVFPTLPDHIKIAYTPAQLEWAEAHERFVWAHFIDHELLFTTESVEIGKFTNDGPFTVDLVKESPARMGDFIGWKIVREYMEDQPAIDLEALMATDAGTILNQSKYKP